MSANTHKQDDLNNREQPGFNAATPDPLEGTRKEKRGETGPDDGQDALSNTEADPDLYDDGLVTSDFNEGGLENDEGLGDEDFADDDPVIEENEDKEQEADVPKKMDAQKQ